MPRKKANIHYLYKTTCLTTSRYYIGLHSTCNLEDGYMGSGNRLRRSIRKYGKENHVKEILEFFETRELLIEAEKKAITQEMLCDVNCMNLVSGGTGGDFISKEQHIRNGSKTGNIHKEKLINDVEYRNVFSKISSERIKKTISEGKLNHNRKTFLGKNHSEETKQKIAVVMKGKGLKESNSQYGTMWITNGSENRKINKMNHIPEGWYKGRI
jgi:hypothetical protein